MQNSSFNNFLSDGKNGFSEAEGIIVLSLFDGMSCGRLALERAGIKVKQYYAAEIDKHAIQVTQHNFPNTIQLGDVTKVFAKDLPKIDLLIGGSPCQGFSFAGKQLAFDDPRSKLFFEFVRLKNDCNPTYFLLENVKMKKEFELIISKYMGVAPIEINSALLSAQNRVRLYWTNIANEPYGLFGDMQCMIPQPKDKGILLRDILESDVMDKYYLSDKAIATAIRKSDIGINPKINPDKSGTVTCGNQSAKFSIDNSTTLIVASCGRNPENPKSRESGLNTEQMLEPRYDGKTNCLTSVQKDNLVMQLNQSTESNGCQPYQQNRVYDIDGISPALMAQMSCGTHAILEQGMKIRRLTPTECERLQTVPDGATKFCLSKHFLYICSETNVIKIWLQNVELQGALQISQAKKMDYATNITFDLLELEQLKENLLQRMKSANTKDVSIINELLRDIALPTTKDGSITEQLNCLNEYFSKTKNVNIAILPLEKKEAEQEECVIDITKIGLDTKTHYIQIINAMKLNQEGIMVELVVKNDTGLYWKIQSVENCNVEKLYIILTLIKQIIVSKIYTYAKIKTNIKAAIYNLKLLQPNYISAELSDFWMENISLNSDTQRYRMLGNGWTVDVIAHIFSFMALQKPKSVGIRITKLQNRTKDE